MNNSDTQASDVNEAEAVGPAAGDREMLDLAEAHELMDEANAAFNLED